MEQPQHKQIRIPNFDYAQTGSYFITICTQDRKPILSRISLTSPDFENPQGVAVVALTDYGAAVARQIDQMGTTYPHLSVDNYVIMPDHVHILLTYTKNDANGPGPNVSAFVGTFKRFCNRAYGENIWQPRFYDHVIRNQEDYIAVWEYIDGNPMKWII